jgi:hypothetical protein
MDLGVWVAGVDSHPEPFAVSVFQLCSTMVYESLIIVSRIIPYSC